MSKITRKKLVKGTKLQSQPIFSLQAGVNNYLQTQGVDEENLDKYESSFRLNWSMPQLYYSTKADPAINAEVDSAYYARVYFPNEQVYNYPFILPATQDIWTQGINEKSKYYTLRDITFSQDQGDEPIAYVGLPIDTRWTDADYAVATDTTYSPYQLEMNTPEFNYNFRLTLWSKTPYVVNDNITIWEDEIGSWEIPFTAFVNPNMGFNPFVIENLNIQLSPDKSYCFTLEFTGNPQQLIFTFWGDEDPTTGYFDQYLKNLQFSFRFTTPLRAFDVETSSTISNPAVVQNYPHTYINGQNGNETITPILPNTPIEANPLQGNIETIDHQFQHKLQGGHNTLWSKPFAAQQTDLAAYDIITIPLLNNTSNMRWGGFDVGKYPYVSLDTTDPNNILLTSFGDRKVLSIYQPFTIHSAYVGFQKEIANACNPARKYHITSNTDSLIPGLIDIELVMHSGWRADRTATQQIAKISIDGDDLYNPTLVDAAIDPVIQSNNRQNSANYSVGLPSIFLYQMSLNGTQLVPVPKDIGFFDQGLPYYIGRGIGKNSDVRTYVTDSSGDENPPKTLGQEKLLEARIKVSGLSIPKVTNPVPPREGFPPIDDTVRIWNGICIPGVILYLVVKKSLVKSEW